MEELEVELKDLTIGSKLYFRTKGFQINFSKQSFGIVVLNEGRRVINVELEVYSNPQSKVFETPVSSTKMTLLLKADFDLSIIEIYDKNTNKLLYPKE